MNFKFLPTNQVAVSNLTAGEVFRWNGSVYMLTAMHPEMFVIPGYPANALPQAVAVNLGTGHPAKILLAQAVEPLHGSFVEEER
jgi:hypothetical protein